MKAQLAVLCVLVGLVVSTPADKDSRVKRGGHHEIVSYGGGKTTSLGGKQLVALAQGAADQANSAIVSQQAAAGQAAFQATQALAQNAEQAANTAKAALAGKLVIASRLEQELHDAQDQLGAEAAQLEVSQVVAQLAAQVAQQAQGVASALATVVAAQQSSAAASDTLRQKALREVAAQTDMLQRAKLRVSQLAHELHEVREDLAATQNAALRAEQAAQLAQVNAAKSASSGDHGAEYEHH